MTDDDWEVGDFSSGATQRMTLVGEPTIVRRFSFPFLHAQLVIEYNGSLPDWFPTIIASLEELADLPANWDSYGAKPIRRPSILAAIELLLCVVDDKTPAPIVVPTNRGTVMFEWHTRGIDLEVEVFSPGRLHVAFEVAGEDAEQEMEMDSDLSPLIDCIRRLADAD
jgi:hypothetical protein